MLPGQATFYPHVSDACDHKLTDTCDVFRKKSMVLFEVLNPYDQPSVNGDGVTGNFWGPMCTMTSIVYGIIHVVYVSRLS